MRTLSVYKRAWRFCLSGAVLIGLVACATGPSRISLQEEDLAFPSEPKECSAYRNAWVALFKANVSSVSNGTPLPEHLDESLNRSRQKMITAGVTESDCNMPYCMIQPLQGGKLDSYCGYRLAADGGSELYRWVPWTEQ